VALEITNTTDPMRGSDQTTRVPKQNLGKDDFLLLLTKQLQNQDPLNPMDNTQMIAQTANFSTLEQITNMSNNLSKFLDSTNSYKTQAVAMLGKTVSAKVEGQSDSLVGQITAVRFENNEAIFGIGDTEVKMADIEAVAAG